MVCGTPFHGHRGDRELAADGVSRACGLDIAYRATLHLLEGRLRGWSTTEAIGPRADSHSEMASPRFPSRRLAMTLERKARVSTWRFARNAIQRSKTTDKLTRLHNMRGIMSSPPLRICSSIAWLPLMGGYVRPSGSVGPVFFWIGVNHLQNTQGIYG